MRADSIFVRLLLIVAVGIVVTGVSRAGSIEIIDPHTEPARCSSCHSQNPTEEEVLAGELHLLAGTIDETCHICHPYDCCRINSLKGHNHPSNVDKWDVDDFTEPENLPLFEGYITCSTCHYHRMAEITGQNYRMVRLVDVGLGKVDWTRLCKDCHTDY